MSEQTENVVAVKALEEMATYTAVITAAAMSLVTGGFEAWLVERNRAYLLHIHRKPYDGAPPALAMSADRQANFPYATPADSVAAALETNWLMRGQGGYQVNSLARLHALVREYFEARLEELASAPAWPRTNTPEGKEEERAWALAALAKLKAETAPPATDRAEEEYEVAA